MFPYRHTYAVSGGSRTSRRRRHPAAKRGRRGACSRWSARRRRGRRSRAGDVDVAELELPDQVGEQHQQEGVQRETDDWEDQRMQAGRKLVDEGPGRSLDKHESDRARTTEAGPPMMKPGSSQASTISTAPGATPRRSSTASRGEWRAFSSGRRWGMAAGPEGGHVNAPIRPARRTRPCPAGSLQSAASAPRRVGTGSSRRR